MAEHPEPVDAGAILAALVEAGVDFIVIGGHAVGAHGFTRATKDVDIVPAPDRENLARLASVLDGLDHEIVGMEEFARGEVAQPDLEGLLGGGSWVLRTKHGRLYVMQLVPPDLEYDDLDAEAVDADVFGFDLRLCGYDHLILMKETAGRPQDRIDLQRLREARGELE